MVTSDPKRRGAYERLCDIDPRTSATIEVFYADRALAECFGPGAGWFWWCSTPGLSRTQRVVHSLPATRHIATRFNAYGSDTGWPLGHDVLCSAGDTTGGSRPSHHGGRHMT
jgi:hypothetical protein